MMYKLNSIQQLFVSCNQPAKAIIGGRGVGKTTAMCIDIVRNLVADIPIVVIVPDVQYQKELFEPKLKEVAKEYGVDVSGVKYYQAKYIRGGRLIPQHYSEYIYIPSLARTFPCDKDTSLQVIKEYLETLGHIVSRYNVRIDYHPGYFIKSHFTEFLEKQFTTFKATFEDNAMNLPNNYPMEQANDN